ncbi:protein-tyrosine phosphatase-like, PTPLA, partial [Kipferlia bialata]
IDFTIACLYIPFFPVLYKHMLKQRKKFFAKTSPKKTVKTE